ncbi:MAG: hypothetical protein RJB61_2282 [Actinomycetota bacterium]
MSDFDAVASCVSAADGSLDGVVTVWIDGQESRLVGLADGDHQVAASGVDAAYAIDAVIACDAELPSASIVVAGVGAAPVPADAEPMVLATSLAAAPTAAPSAVQLPATGATAGAMLAGALVLVAVGAALRRLSRPAA